MRLAANAQRPATARREANYIISGKGEVTDLRSEESWPLEADIRKLN